MSIFSNTHDLKAFDSKTSRAADGQRLSKMIYKTGKDGKKEHASHCVSIPRLSPQYIDLDNKVQRQRLIPHIVTMLEDGQDRLIRSLFESGRMSVSDADISFDSVISYLDAESAGDRLTKDGIERWFDSVVLENITVMIADKLSLPDTLNEQQEKRLGQMIARYRDGFAMLAGGKTKHGKDFVVSLLKVLSECVDADDMLRVRFTSRLEKMLAEPAYEDML